MYTDCESVCLGVSPIHRVNDQMMPLGPKVATSWGLYVLHRLNRENVKKILSETTSHIYYSMYVALSSDHSQVCSNYAPGAKSGPTLEVTCFTLTHIKKN